MNIRSHATTRASGFFFASSISNARVSMRTLLVHILAVETEFWHRAKTRTVQFMAGAASLLWAITLLFEQARSFFQPAFTMMREQAPAWVWAVIFAGHTACVLVCRWSPVAMLRFQWWTSLYGFVIWTYYVGSAWWSSHHPLVGTSFELVGIGMLAWSLRRAGNELAEAAHADS